MRRVVRSALDEIDCDVVAEAENGSTALAVVNEHNPHLILLDIQMPEQNGIETLKQILESHPDAYVVMMTSVDDDETIAKCISAGAKDYLGKTMPLSEMMGRLREHVAKIHKA